MGLRRRSFEELTISGRMKKMKQMRLVKNLVVPLYLRAEMTFLIRMKHILFFFVGALILLSSCVTNKKYTFLQKNDVNKSMPFKDSVLRDYNLSSYNYRIQPNDLVSVRFESLTPDEYNFFSTYKGSTSSNLNLSAGGGLLYGELVDENGEIAYPVVGKVKIAGLTIFEVQEKLQKLAEQYLESPVVKARLLNFRATFLGEVNKEGTFTFTNNRISLMEAIGIAGGLTDLADKSNVKLIRQRDGQTEVLYIDLLKEEFLSSPNYFVNQNDIYIIPALRQRPYRKYFGQNLSLIISSISLLLLVINLSKN